jgi:hypothetical protein
MRATSAGISGGMRYEYGLLRDTMFDYPEHLVQ